MKTRNDNNKQLNRVKQMANKLKKLVPGSPEAINKRKELVLLIVGVTEQEIKNSFFNALKKHTKDKASIEEAIRIRTSIPDFSGLENFNPQEDNFEYDRIVGRFKAYFNIEEKDMPCIREAIIVDAVTFAAGSDLSQEFQLKLVTFINKNNHDSAIFDLASLGLAEGIEDICVEAMRELKKKGSMIRLKDPEKGYNFTDSFIQAIEPLKDTEKQNAFNNPLDQASDPSIFNRIKQGISALGNWCKKHPVLTALAFVGIAAIIVASVCIAWPAIGMAGVGGIAAMAGVKTLAIAGTAMTHIHFGIAAGAAIIGSFGIAVASSAMFTGIKNALFTGVALGASSLISHVKSVLKSKAKKRKSSTAFILSVSGSSSCFETAHCASSARTECSAQSTSTYQPQVETRSEAGEVNEAIAKSGRGRSFTV